MTPDHEAGLSFWQMGEVTKAAKAAYEALVAAGCLPPPVLRGKTEAVDKFRRREMLGVFDLASITHAGAHQFREIVDHFKNLGCHA